MYEIEYYIENNKSPVYEFISELNIKEQAKTLREIDLLSEFGLPLGFPHISKMVGTDLWELRIKHSSNHFRIFYFCFTNNKFVLLHGIRKTTNKTPKGDLELATKRMKIYLQGSELK